MAGSRERVADDAIFGIAEPNLRINYTTLMALHNVLEIWRDPKIIKVGHVSYRAMSIL